MSSGLAARTTDGILTDQARTVNHSRSLERSKQATVTLYGMFDARELA
jgi:hypothetical protein